MGFITDSIRKQSSFVSKIHHQEGISVVSLWTNWLWCFFRYGATPSDWFCYEMYRYRHNHLRNIITRRKNLKIDRLFNPREFRNTFDNKKLFNETFKKFINRRWVYTGDENWINRVRVLGGLVVVKPIGLSSGRGIFTIDLDKHDDTDLKKIINGQNFLIEDKIELCEDLRQLNPPSCNTIRVYTIIDRNGDVVVVDAVLRVGGGNSIQDNFHAQGVVYPIDSKSGRVKGCGKDLLNNEYLKHPTSGLYMPGFQIPRWCEVIKFVKEVAKVNKNARFIGWDIAVTPHGCELIEGNYYVYCGLMQIFDKTGKYHLIKSFL